MDSVTPPTHNQPFFEAPPTPQKESSQKTEERIQHTALSTIKAQEEARRRPLHPRSSDRTDPTTPTSDSPALHEMKRPRTASEREEALRKPETLMKRLSVWQSERIDVVKKPHLTLQQEKSAPGPYPYQGFPRKNITMQHIVEARDPVALINQLYGSRPTETELLAITNSQCSEENKANTFAKLPATSTISFPLEHCTADVTHALGGRLTQEDGHIWGQTSAIYDGVHIPFFAICDGHSGTGAKDFLLARLPSLMNETFHEQFPDSILPPDPFERARAIDDCLLKVSIQAEKELTLRKNHLGELLHIAQIPAETILNPPPGERKNLTQNEIRELTQIQKNMGSLPPDSIKTIRSAIIKLIQEKSHTLPPETVTHFITSSREITEKQNWGGSTLTMASIIGQEVWTMNVGDSRTIATDRTGTHQLTQDASLTDEKFRRSVLSRGGVLTEKKTSGSNQWQVSKLEVARSFEGGRVPAISARAKITRYPIPEGGTTLVLGCDGLFDVVSSEAVGTLVQKIGPSHPTMAPSELLTKAAFVLGSNDNISAMVIQVDPR